MLRFFIFVAIIAVAPPASAEVMDKELSVPDIWRGAAISVASAVVASLIHRWLLPLSFVAAFVTGTTFAWTEWHSADVGPHIAREAGTQYGVHANSAMAVIVVAQLGLWLFVVRRAYQRLLRLGQEPGQTFSRFTRESFIYAVVVALLTAVATRSGFGSEPTILFSPPALVAALGVAAGGAAYVKARGRVARRL